MRIAAQSARTLVSVPAFAARANARVSLREALPVAAYAGNQAALRRLSQSAMRMQCKLQVGAVNDPLEAEADRTAEQVMRMSDSPAIASAPLPNSQLQRAPDETEVAGRAANTAADGVVVDEDLPIPGEPTPPTAPDKPLQRCAACDAEAKKLQPKRAAQGALSTAPAEAMSRQPGAPLDPAARSWLEPRFGRRFDRVRVHTGPDADISARAVSALAYTVGSDIVFRSGQYRPGTSDGNRLLAHELTHVVQQGAAAPTPASGAADRPVQSPSMASGTMLQRWGVNGSDPGLNTCVCDGNGDIAVQLGNTGNADQTECLRDCMRTHELSHRADALAAKADICKNKGAGGAITADAGAQQKATEIKASNAEIACLQAKHPPAGDKCKSIIDARITQMQQYRDSFR